MIIFIKQGIGKHEDTIHSIRIVLKLVIHNLKVINEQLKTSSRCYTIVKNKLKMLYDSEKQ